MEYTKEDVLDWLQNPVTLNYKQTLIDESTSLLASIVQNIHDHNECLKIAGQYQAYLDIINSMEALRE